MTTPEKKQDGTIELDVGQIDLLDLPLPPRSTPEVSSTPSKGPPPLPPPPAEAQADTNAAEEPGPADAKATPVPSLPPPPAPPPRPAVSARKLVDGTPERGGSLGKFLLGVGAASVVCVGAFFVLRALHKTPAPQARPAPSAAPAQAFTMAPIEFTEPATSASASAAAPSTSSAPAASHAQSAPAHTGHAPALATAKPAAHDGPRAGRSDDVIKVEN